MSNRTSSTNKHHTKPQSSKLRQTQSATSTQLLSTTSISIQRKFPWRLSEHWTKSITARSRRRRAMSISPTAVTPVVAATEAPASSTSTPLHTPLETQTVEMSATHQSNVRPAFAMLRSVSLSLPLSTTAAYVALLVLSTTCSLCAGSPCQAHRWWDPVKDKCIPCTECQGQLIVLRPCQLHRDTICGSIYDLEIDWLVLAKTEPNWKERRKSDLNVEEREFTHEELQQLELQQQQQHEETIPLDWQTAALFLAVLACLLFFIVAACILIQHMRQWRRMERRLDQDVEELSTKLMAKLAEVQSLEGGTFFIGNADALKGPATFQPQHVLLPEKPVKHSERRVLKTLQPGNVYIEESSSKG